MNLSRGFDTINMEEVLHRASNHIFSMGLNDAANQLCNCNMQYGLAKIHIAQSEMGQEPDATFIGAPDATVTRNPHRWSFGFGYGGKVSWGSGTDDLIILDAMPNACGMMIGGLDELPGVADLVDKVDAIFARETTIDGIEIDWDFAVGNHFVDVFRFENSHHRFPFEYTFIIHGSVPELKGDNPTQWGFGLYYHRSAELRKIARTITTPLGDVHVLTDEAAGDYLEFLRFAEELARKKRLKAAELLFKDFKPISNPLHQGLLNMNEMVLGCQSIPENGENVFPIALRADQPAYLVEGKRNLEDSTIDRLNFRERAEEYGVLGRLRNLNIIPHGGGYTFLDLVKVKRVLKGKDQRRYFVAEIANTKEGTKIFASPGELAFTYRGEEVVKRALELKLCSIVAKMSPEIVLKIS
ncbi:MAG: hypothetical protein R6V83_13700 [Candidatus Thorarchaeota archaeon]